MVNESRINVYIRSTRLAPRQRERIQAQLQSALRLMPAWALALVDRRVFELGAHNLAIEVVPVFDGDTGTQVLSLGISDGKPAARLMPRVRGDHIDWGQNHRALIAKAVGYLMSPNRTNVKFWDRWSEVVEQDKLRVAAEGQASRWKEATDTDLLLEMFAAYALNPTHGRWSAFPQTKRFLEEWR